MALIWQLGFARRLFSAGHLAKTKAEGRQNAMQVVKQATQTSINFVFVGGSVILTGAVLYSITNALFSPSSPYNVRDKSFNQIRENQEVIKMIGEPMKALAETPNRRRHLVHSEEQINGVKHVKVQYHISGPHSQGDVFAEAKHSGWFGPLDFNYIVVACPRRNPIYIIDKRGEQS